MTMTGHICNFIGYLDRWLRVTLVADVLKKNSYLWASLLSLCRLIYIACDAEQLPSVFALLKT